MITLIFFLLVKFMSATPPKKNSGYGIDQFIKIFQHMITKLDLRIAEGQGCSATKDIREKIAHRKKFFFSYPICLSSKTANSKYFLAGR